MASITLDNVSKNFKSVQAVDQINIDIKDGEFITLVGPSGCGKTTSLRLIAGLEEVSTGTIKFGDDDLTNSPPNQRNVGMVFQNLALYPHMSVRENMSFGMDIARLDESTQKKQIQNAARMLDIEELLDRQPNQLSGGQQQRVAIGRTIVLDPDVFLLDEPLASLDAKLRVKIREELQELQNQIDITTIYVTHDQEQAMTMSDRIVVMNEGSIQQFASPTELYKNPNNEFVANFIGTPSINFFDAIIKNENDNIEIDLGFHTINQFEAHSIVGNQKHVRLGIRPEHIQIDSAETDKFIANVKFVEPTGKENIVHLECDDEELTAITSGEMNISRHEEHEITFEQEHLHIFDPETGENITSQLNKPQQSEHNNVIADN